jgi:clan AA aspartic protease
MGLTYIEGEVTGPAGRSTRVTFLVDSGAGYCLLPEDAWKAIGLTPRRSQTFILADGTRLERRISECHLRLAGEEGHVPVILGQPGDEALVGVIALEVLGLTLDPFRRQLQPARMRL